jgi:hypothetical protein
MSSKQWERDKLQWFEVLRLKYVAPVGKLSLKEDPDIELLKNILIASIVNRNKHRHDKLALSFSCYCYQYPCFQN